MPKISVIMASYNHAAFVHQAIESVLAQSYKDFELVITDDGSSDGTAEVIRRVADPRIRFHALAENQGACVAVNDAIARSQGEYIAVLNSDDYFLPGKLERQAGFLDAHPEIGAVFGQPQFVDENGRDFHNPNHSFVKAFASENRPRQEWLRYFFYFQNCLCHPTAMVRKACYERVGVFDPLLMQLPDLDLWVRLCREFEIHILPEKLTGFRILNRESNVSAPTKEKASRSAWETCSVLGHYGSLSEPELRAIFPEAQAAPPGSARVFLALEAIKIGTPGYLQFGLALLKECLGQNDKSISYAKYFALVGETDPFGTQFLGREHQILKKSRVLGSARKLVRWWRSRNFRR
jgi:glycosyltransferase involved in cell wall biosynthesis